ncbi:DNA cytosine methyltransferase [Salmonella enterica subsp. enterica serovar Dublin]|nr:DNA cytosine methyltransferase [Salmonella enterica subsp. enterica serovar Dublin]
MAQPWAEAGHTCYCFNYDGADHGDYARLGAKVEHENIHYINEWIDNKFDFEVAPDIIFSFPPCTDLAVSGAAHFETKRKKNATFQVEAVITCKVAARLAKKYNVPYMIENPVSVLSSLWRKPDYAFNPYEYGGYLPEDDTHPMFPDVIPARDAYVKKTCLWVGNGFVMPDVADVAVGSGDNPGWAKLGGKSARTKTIRSLTPRGFAKAVYEANHV